MAFSRLFLAGHDKIIKFRGCFCEAEPTLGPSKSDVKDLVVHSLGDRWPKSRKPQKNQNAAEKGNVWPLYISLGWWNSIPFWEDSLNLKRFAGVLNLGKFDRDTPPNPLSSVSGSIPKWMQFQKLCLDMFNDFFFSKPLIREVLLNNLKQWDLGDLYLMWTGYMRWIGFQTNRLKNWR